MDNFPFPPIKNKTYHGSSEASHRESSNEGPYYMFLLINKNTKISELYMLSLKSTLTGAPKPIALICRLKPAILPPRIEGSHEGSQHMFLFRNKEIVPTLSLLPLLLRSSVFVVIAPGRCRYAWKLPKFTWLIVFVELRNRL